MATHKKSSVAFRRLGDGEYIAKCIQTNLISAAANGHSQVFPEANMIVKEGKATFYMDGKEVWSCNSEYAATHFEISKKEK